MSALYQSYISLSSSSSKTEVSKVLSSIITGMHSSPTKERFSCLWLQAPSPAFDEETRKELIQALLSDLKLYYQHPGGCGKFNTTGLYPCPPSDTQPLSLFLSRGSTGIISSENVGKTSLWLWNHRLSCQSILPSFVVGIASSWFGVKLWSPTMCS